MPLAVREFRAREFRSLKAVTYPMTNLDVFVGANGAGKSNLYRALELLRSSAGNTLSLDLAQQGGLASALWAGGRRKSEPARIHLSVSLSDEMATPHASGLYRYEVEVGHPPPAAAAFAEPHVKAETLAFVGPNRTTRLLHREGPSVMVRDEAGRPVQIALDMLPSETVLGRLEDPSRYPEVDAVRRTLMQWRFYHGLRTDAASPIRHPCPAVATPTLASDGSDLAAVFATLVHIREDTTDLDAVIDQAFPGARLEVPRPERTARFGMSFPEFPQRVFGAEELSDGTLRFLTLAGALLGYRLPPFIALNEPEASLHPDMMEPLAQLVAGAAERTQVWLVTHSTRLADAIAGSGAAKVRTVIKDEGATRIERLRSWGAFEEDD